MTVRVRINCELTLRTKITIVEMAKLFCRVRRVRILLFPLLVRHDHKNQHLSFSQGCRVSRMSIIAYAWDSWRRIVCHGEDSFPVLSPPSRSVDSPWENITAPCSLQLAHVPAGYKGSKNGTVINETSNPHRFVRDFVRLIQRSYPQTVVAVVLPDSSDASGWRGARRAHVVAHVTKRVLAVLRISSRFRG
jgi:hypothetical protein